MAGHIRSASLRRTGLGRSCGLGRHMLFCFEPKSGGLPRRLLGAVRLSSSSSSSSSGDQQGEARQAPPLAVGKPVSAQGRNAGGGDLPLDSSVPAGAAGDQERSTPEHDVEGGWKEETGVRDSFKHAVSSFAQKIVGHKETLPLDPPSENVADADKESGAETSQNNERVSHTSAVAARPDKPSVIANAASGVASTVRETVEHTVELAREAIEAGKDKTLEGAVSQMVKVLKVSVYQLVEEGFTKATVSSGVNVMGVVNLNVSVHLEEEMAAHFKQLEAKEKRRRKRQMAKTAASQGQSDASKAEAPRTTGDGPSSGGKKVGKKRVKKTSGDATKRAASLAPVSVKPTRKRQVMKKE